MLSIAATSGGTPTSVVIIVAVVPAAITALVAIFSVAAGRWRDARDRRRAEYSEAYKLALEWCESVYRVRRRASDGSQDRELVERFHQLQERIAYYEGWVGIESQELGASYQRFLHAVLSECEPLLRDAWSHRGREPTEPKPPNEMSPNVAVAKNQFVADVRKHFQRWWDPPDNPLAEVDHATS